MREYIKTLGNVLVKPLKVRQTPIHIQLEPTTYCNLNCNMCGRAKYFDTSVHLSLENFRRILDQIRPRKITLSGAGEPFMNPYLLDMVQLAKQYGCSINTTTNCTLFSQERCEQIVRSGLDLIKISIDGASPETYHKIRGEDNFLNVVDGIRALNDAKKRLGSEKPFIRFNFVISKENYFEITMLIELAERLEVDAIYFQPLELIGIEERSELLVGNLSYEALSEELTRALAVSQHHHVHTNLESLLQKLPLYWKKYQLETRSRNNRICILPWFSSYITVDGYVRPCCSFSQTKANMGNILTTSLADIWNGESYCRFRQAMRKGIRPYPICENCVPQTLGDIVKSSGILPGFLS